MSHRWIMVVDSDPASVGDLKRALRRLDVSCGVVDFDVAYDALDYLRRTILAPPLLTVIDWELPGDTASSLVSALHRDTPVAGTPTFLTATFMCSRQDGIMRRCAVRGHIMKSLLFDAYCHAVERIAHFAARARPLPALRPAEVIVSGENTLRRHDPKSPQSVRFS